MFKKILLATTPQIDTQTAPKAAFDMVRKYDAELLIYHALPIGKDDWCSFDDTIPAQKLVEASAAKIREFYAEDLKTIPNHSIRVITGASHDKLFKLVHTEGVDLIVMGHHTSASIYPGSMLGSVNTAIRDVCSNAFCPTMVVTHEGSKSANIKKIVFATDFPRRPTPRSATPRSSPDSSVHTLTYSMCSTPANAVRIRNSTCRT